MSEHCENCGSPDDGSQTYCPNCGEALVDHDPNTFGHGVFDAGSRWYSVEPRVIESEETNK